MTASPTDKATVPSKSSTLSKMRWWVGGLGVSAALATGLVSFNAHADRHGNGPACHMDMKGGGDMMGMSHMNGPKAERMYKRLGVTPAQQAQLQSLSQAQRADMTQMRQNHQALHVEVKAALAQPTISDATVQALRTKVLAQHQEMAAKRWDHMVAVARVLTPEQRQKMASMMEKRHGRDKGDRHDGARQWRQPAAPAASAPAPL